VLFVFRGLKCLIEFCGRLEFSKKHERLGNSGIVSAAKICCHGFSAKGFARYKLCPFTQMSLLKAQKRAGNSESVVRFISLKFCRFFLVCQYSFRIQSLQCAVCSLTYRARGTCCGLLLILFIII